MSLTINIRKNLAKGCRNISFMLLTDHNINVSEEKLLAVLYGEDKKYKAPKEKKEKKDVESPAASGEPSGEPSGETKEPAKPKAPRAKKEKAEPKPTCKGCSKHPSKDDNGYCGMCLRKPAVQEAIRKGLAGVGDKVELVVEPIDEENNIFKHSDSGTDAVLRLGSDRSYTAIGKVDSEGGPLLPLSEDEIGKYKNTYHVNYEHDPSVKVTPSVPVPSDVPEL